VIGAMGSSGILVFCLVIAAFAAIVWLIKEILTRRDFSPGMKALWIVLAIFFSLGTLIVWLLVVRKKDYSKS